MNPFAQRKKNPSRWVIPVTIVALLSGFLISIAFTATQAVDSRMGNLPPEIINPALLGSLDLADEVAKLRSEVSKLREEKGRLESTLANQGNASSELNKSLQDVKKFAGLTDLEGPGLIVTLDDSKKSADEMLIANDGVVHFIDVLKTVNELFNAGAEAISVNGLRVGPGTDFRCVGTTILVDSQKIAPPVVIQAIGDQKTLMGAINMPGGILEDLRSIDPAMAKVEPADKLYLPAFDGTTTGQFGKVPEAKP